MQAEVDLVTLPLDEWAEMRRAAAELDLVRGGYFRARPQGVLFYCDPANAPEGWTGGFAEGTPEAPRALVGEAEAVGLEGDDHIVLRLLVSNWQAMRSVKEAYDRGEYRGRWAQFHLDQESAFRGNPEEREWLRTRFERLRQYAAGLLLSPGGDDR